MGEAIYYLKDHLTEHFAVYFFLLYIFGGRPGAVLSAMAVGMNTLVVICAVVVLDTFQVPMFYYLYNTVSKRIIVRKLTLRARRKMSRIRRSALFRKLGCLGPPGVVTIAMLPVKGCGMWSGVLMARVLGLPTAKSYGLLIAGSFIGCLILAGAGEAILLLIGWK